MRGPCPVKADKMAYPNIAVADVRDGISHITTTIKSDARVTKLIIEATRWIESKMHSKVDITAIKALSTTPGTWQDIIIYRTRALVLAEAYGTSRALNSEDIKTWNELAISIVNELIEGTSKLLDADSNLLETGMNFKGVESNKNGADASHDKPLLGMGVDGVGVNNVNDEEIYP